MDFKPLIHTPTGLRSPLAAFIIAILILLFLAQAFWSIKDQDITYDEGSYFAVGQSILTTGKWTAPGVHQHPPLAYYVSSLPLLLFGEQPQISVAMLRLARLTSLVVFGIPLLIVIFFWAKELYGVNAGLVALALAAFSPNLLAHSGLITIDFPLTSVGFIALYLGWRYRREGTWLLFLAWSVMLGLALLTKASAWLFAIAVVLLWPAAPPARRSGRHYIFLAAGLLIAWFVLNLGYGFSGFFDFQGKQELLSQIYKLHLVMRLLTLLFPLPYMQMTVLQWRIGQAGWPAFLLGEFSNTGGWWYYFLVAFLIKATVPFLLLLTGGVVLFKRTRAAWTDELWLIMPPVILFGFFSFIGRIDIGVRYVLPAFPFLMVFASKVVRLADRLQWVGTVVIGALLAWHVAAAVIIFPEYLAYFNELVGGPSRGYKYLADSNIDWGQNQSRASAYAQQQGILFEPDELPPGRQAMVSVNDLIGIMVERTRYRQLREEYEPVGRVGYNWFIFDPLRNRRFPELDIVPMLSGPAWRSAPRAQSGWELPDFDDSAWAQAVTKHAAIENEYIETKAVPMIAATPGIDGYFRRRFDLERQPAQAILHFAAADRFEIFVNGRPIATSQKCGPEYSKEEYTVTKLLRPGRNVIAIHSQSCDGRACSPIFLEMRVAQKPL
jgi:4-amino-4-deoxy-L-arabinose transferase-like glycosyltransferase